MEIYITILGSRQAIFSFQEIFSSFFDLSAADAEAAAPFLRRRQGPRSPIWDALGRKRPSFFLFSMKTICSSGYKSILHRRRSGGFSALSPALSPGLCLLSPCPLPCPGPPRRRSGLFLRRYRPPRERGPFLPLPRRNTPDFARHTAQTEVLLSVIFSYLLH